MKKCKECGNECYDFVATCKNCGYEFPKLETDVKHLENESKSDYALPLISMILGIVGMLFSCMGIGIIFSIAGLVLGIIALSKEMDKKAFSITGVVCSSVSFFIFLIFIIAILSSSNDAGNVEQEVLQEQLKEIEEESIYGSVSETEDEISVESEKTLEQKEEFKEKNQDSVLSVGIYVAGEDIEVGKYNFNAINGSGDIKIYKAYEDYKADEYGLDAFDEYRIMAVDSSVGLLNKDVYSNSVSCIRLEQGNCLIIDKGVEIHYEKIIENIYNTSLTAGTYLVGEDIEPGKFDVNVISGSGELKIYNSYDLFLEDEYGLDAFEEYNLKSEDASVGLLNEDTYSYYVSNLRFEEGQLIKVEDGLKLELIVK